LKRQIGKSWIRRELFGTRHRRRGPGDIVPWR
jgi:hypothetical protein